MAEPNPSTGCCRKHTHDTRELVLCFDGTGNTLGRDDTGTNILRIFRILDRTKENRFCYYQPGIGTECVPASFAGMPLNGRALIFGTNKVLDMALATSFDQHVLGGYRFLMRRYKPGAKIYLFGFSRGAYTARFLSEMLDFIGLPNTDNEELIPLVWKAFWTFRFGSEKHHRKQYLDAAMFVRACRETLCNPVARTHFLGLFDTVNSVAELRGECEGVPTARIIRHAVSIDERRLKFQPVLIEPRVGNQGNWRLEKRSKVNGNNSKNDKSNNISNRKEEAEEDSGDDDDDDLALDLEEIYFAGDHSDVGGGHEHTPTDAWPASQVPLTWMVNEAMKAGLTFERNKLMCELGSETFDTPGRTEYTDNILKEAGTYSTLHDSLDFDDSKNKALTFFWRVLEILPFKRLHSQSDGSQKLSRRPVRGGIARAIPSNPRVHGSVVYRLRARSDYRPTNLAGATQLREGKYETDDWVCLDEGKIGECWIRKDGQRVSTLGL
ncbi:hypothetical protein EMCG_01207 [[Emmonsia] crescens]|uniref:T6SS Phospholipase effector Tle1-like catalytic domain-containing protein n=1 Tax=[Emmonsia] crescens TaxID=73230 RepID=A0A0G2I5C5_9EURO|nr:hypothetical protein EMCG_01207 [Emmonsia crescens UAMH 3008]